MVVLAAAVVSKSGKPLVSRQFVEMARIRIEGLLAAFPKLVGTGKQHTYVETDNVRYVYQPMEGIYLLLVTNKQSNILEDLETLRLLAKLLPEYVQSLEEESICAAAFELIFAFDEAISLGLKENVTVQQVRTYTDMESHEEKLHKMIIQSKINDTKDVMKRKAVEIDKTKAEKRMEGGMGMGGGGMGGGGMGGFGGGADDFSKFGIDAPAPPPVERPSAFDRPSGGMGGGRGGVSAPAKGMQLGKAKGANAFLDALKADADLADASGPGPAGGAGGAAQAPSDPVEITIEEHLTVRLKKDGGMETMEVQGTMTLEVHDEAAALCRVVVEQGDTTGFQFKTHPNIDKGAFGAESVLGLKDPNRPFPTGSALGVLKWRFQTADESRTPISINCWPSVSGQETYVNIEYETDGSRDLHNVQISIPVPPCRDPPSVTQVDGEFTFDQRRGTLDWDIELIDASNASGSLEFVLPQQADTAAFFPIDVRFSAVKTFCDIAVGTIVDNASGEAVKYSATSAVAVDSYQVV